MQMQRCNGFSVIQFCSSDGFTGQPSIYYCKVVSDKGGPEPSLASTRLRPCPPPLSHSAVSRSPSAIWRHAPIGSHSLRDNREQRRPSPLALGLSTKTLICGRRQNRWESGGWSGGTVACAGARQPPAGRGTRQHGRRRLGLGSGHLAGRSRPGRAA